MSERHKALCQPKIDTMDIHHGGPDYNNTFKKQLSGSMIWMCFTVVESKTSDATLLE